MITRSVACFSPVFFSLRRCSARSWSRWAVRSKTVIAGASTAAPFSEETRLARLPEQAGKAFAYNLQATIDSDAEPMYGIGVPAWRGPDKCGLLQQS